MARQSTTPDRAFDRRGLSELADWRLIGGRMSAWFDAASHSAGAALIARVVESDPVASGTAAGSAEFDLRARGVRVRIDPAAAVARAISAIAADLGLHADPSALAELTVVIETADRTAVEPFWRTVLGDQLQPDGMLADPLRRNPAVRFEHLDDPRPLRNRLHLDIGRPAEAVESAWTELGLRPHGPFGVALSDPDGNEVDLCPGGPLSQESQTSDWQTMFSALAFYPRTTPGQACDLAVAVAELADTADRPLLIDLRPEGVMIDSGKDQWEVLAGADPEFVQLAARIQSVARGLGLTVDPAPYRFIQVGIDAVDIPAVRGFWQQTLGYAYDRRPHVTDLYDPRRLNPVIFFQNLDAADQERRRQRNRLHLELAVPADEVDATVERGVAAGGRLLPKQTRDETADPRPATLTDPEGNELRLIGF